MSGTLERRYRRLLRVYPRAYRSEREDELAGTYLDSVAPDRRWPNARDTLDVLGGGVRQQLRERGARWLGDALPVAAVIALATGALLAAIWLLWFALQPLPDFARADHHTRPLRSLAALAWLAWIATAAIFGIAPGRAARWSAAVSLVLTLACTPVALIFVDYGDPLATYLAPALQIVVPQAALGLLAVAVPLRPGRIVRWLPIVAAAGPALVYLAGFPITETSYRHLSKAVFEGVAPLLLLVGLVTSIALYARRDPRAPWVALLLLIPDGLLFSRRLSGVLTEHIGRPLPTNTPSWALMATVSVVAVLVGLAALALALALASRRPAAGTPLRS